MKKLPKTIKSKAKLIGSFLLIGAILITLYAFLEERFTKYFNSSAEAADKTPPLTTASGATDSVEEVVTDGKFLGDQIITLLDSHDYTLTVPAGATRADFQVQDNPVLLRFGGSPATGGFLCDEDEIHSLETYEEMVKAVFRTQTGISKLIINYWAD